MTRSAAALTLAALALSATRSVVAQPSPVPPAEAPPAAQPPTPDPAQAAPPPAECFPACRAGFFCNGGQCISRCNPQCAANETCTDQGQCIAAAPPPPPPPAAAPAQAPQAPQTSYPSAPPTPGYVNPPEPDAGPEWHTGFYLRLATGLGIEIVSVDYVDPRDTGREGTASTSGLAGVGEFALGGSPAPGVVIGGGIYSAAFTATPEYTLDEKTTADGAASSGARVEIETGALGLLAPFIDIYPGKNSGFHLQGALGYAFTGFEDPDDSDIIPMTGVGAMVGFGIEGRVGKSWGIGGLARLLMAWPSGVDPTDDTETYEGSLYVPGLIFTATCY